VGNDSNLARLVTLSTC